VTLREPELNTRHGVILIAIKLLGSNERRGRLDALLKD
jgi:hypothetical protein